LFLPSVVVAIWAVVTFLLILKTANYTKIFLALIFALLFSDSYLRPFAFAATAKIGMIVILLVYILSNFKDFKGYSNKVFIYFLPFLSFALLASTWSLNPFTALQKSLSYGIVFFVIPLLFQRSRTENHYFTRDIIVAYGVFLLSGILLWLVSPEAGTLAGRFRGLMGNPNGIGTLITVLVIMVFIMYREKYWKHVIDNQTWFFFIATVGVSLFLCGSRTALFAIILFFAFIRLRYFTNLGTLVLFTVIIISYNYILTNLPIIVTALGLEEYLRLDTLEEGSGRFIAWNFSWEQIQLQYFLGGGFGYTEYIFKEYYQYLSQLGHQGNAHNSYLTFWLDTGLLGVLLFLIGLVRTIVVSIKNSSYALPVFYAVLFSANFESWLAASLNPFTCLLLITLTLISSPSSTINEPIDSSDNEDLDNSNLSLT
tara:strand:- start:118 stop:1398 length:1281 start_codon:yes stop_codon:yes gene_type:complete